MDGEFSHTYSAFIKASPGRVWEALTDPSQTVQYFPYQEVRSEWRDGSDVAYTGPDGTVRASGTVVEADEPRRLVLTVNADGFSQSPSHDKFSLIWDIEPFGEATLLTVTHSGPDAIRDLLVRATGHCPHTVSGLKTLVETGAPLRITDPSPAR
ncbi:hypothetical protein SCMU_38590 [Sinomonas cyclohexanicum]|uniref:Activator of Hsp90 ATPase homologue 1/2-like C-terminal domain-containing protein n=1 Tax=Sinomonas cyclohexanicum TaxID=322009 RepID=A0ABN6FMD1_SINCY|nr:SRPBCC domain-containing protein [Corynebacterium cyclohexanicum]BCT78017.1 hypothetical protein SCMU_38590 [Corynebacterium cyclohexanicum]